MPDYDPSEGKDQHPAQKSPETESVNPPPPPDNPNAENAQAISQQNVTTEIHGLQDRISGAEKWMIGLTGGIVFLTAGIVIVGVLQWSAMRGQLHEMKNGGTDTHNLAVAAGNQATWTQNLASNMQTQADRTKDLADRMKDQADQTKTIAEQAVVQANASKRLAQNAADTLTNTKEAFRDEQRAWVGVQGTADSGGFTETEPWQVSVVFFNSGRTPARNVQISGMYLTSPVPLRGPSQEQVKMLQSHPVQSIAPQGFYREVIGQKIGAEGVTSLQLQGLQVLVSQYNQIKHGQLFLYYYGTLTYDDNAGKSRVTEYCIYLADPSTKRAGICDSFNDLY